jgi:hypothetical protein
MTVVHLLHLLVRYFAFCIVLLLFLIGVGLLLISTKIWTCVWRICRQFWALCCLSGYQHYVLKELWLADCQRMQLEKSRMSMDNLEHRGQLQETKQMVARLVEEAQALNIPDKHILSFLVHTYHPDN